ncbi:MAG: amidase, partial [Gemmatimonas sp.]
NRRHFGLVISPFSHWPKGALGEGVRSSSASVLSAEEGEVLAARGGGLQFDNMNLTRREVLAQLSVLVGASAAQRALSESVWSAWAAPAADPLTGTIAEYQAGRLRGDWTAVGVTTNAIARCRALNGELHAIDLYCATALDEAKASDARARRKSLHGLLDGVPVFAKSIYDVRGLQTTASNSEWARLFPEPVIRDATEVERLRAAGAVILGKTVADDFAYHGNGTSTLSGQVRNPHDSAGLKTPGGSSAGSAVSVLCGMAFGALGTDDGGSNRIPAQFVGVVGIKPTFGLVPRSGVIPTWPYLDTHGSLARSVADAALLLGVIAGPDGIDALALKSKWERNALTVLRDDALKGVRVGIVDIHVPRAQMTAEALMVFDRAIADVKSLGATVESFAPAITRVNYRDEFAAAARARGDVAPNANSPAATANALLRYFERHGKDAAQNVQRGLAAYVKYYDVLPKDWAAMQQLITQKYESDPAGVSFARSRASVVAKLAESMKARNIDVMVYPTMPFAAPKASDPWPDVRTTLGYGNWIGLPEVSVPAGLGGDGMPAGNISFVGLPGADRHVLSCAHAYEVISKRFVAPTI